MARSDPQFNVRLPQDIREWLRVRALRNNRTQTGELNAILAELMVKETGSKVKASSLDYANKRLLIAKVEYEEAQRMLIHASVEAALNTQKGNKS